MDLLYRDFSPDLEKRAVSLWKEYGRSWEDDKEEENDRFWQKPFGYVVVENNGELIGTVLLYEREIEFGGESIRLGGFGGVVVQPDYRRQGLATRMLERGMNELKDRKVEVAFLSTDIEKYGGLYATVGFVPLGRMYLSRGKSGRVYEDEGGMVAPVTSREKIEIILQGEGVFDLHGSDW